MSETLQCASCRKGPDETHAEFVLDSGYVSAIEYVYFEEGTLDRATGMYLCDSCYIKHGQPATRMGYGPRWTAHPINLVKLGINP